MPEHKTLLVPVELKALVVNEEVRKGQSFQRWQMDYANLKDFLSPEPQPFNNIAADFSENPDNDGVYLHWSLPGALTHGIQDHDRKSIDFPLVPNRWVVIRYSGALSQRVAKAWVIESDFLDSNHGTVPYIDPFQSTAMPTSMGRALPLNNPLWTETGSKPLFLKAVGPGDITFAAYQPYVKNVFSLHDTLIDVNDKDTLSYLVVGWYSAPDQDVLFSWGANNSFAEKMAALQWTTQAEPESTANASLYHGMVFGLQWNKKGSMPPSPCISAKVKVAVGNTSIDAMTALLKKQIQGTAQSSSIHPELLEAFQYNLLSELDQPNGQALLENKIHQSWFSSRPGGYQWEIMDKELERPTDQTSRPSLTPVMQQQETLLLNQLNQDQVTLDRQQQKLAGLQKDLYALWWKQGRADAIVNITGQMPMNLSQGTFKKALDPANSESMTTKVHKHIITEQTQQAKVPQGVTQTKLQKSINTYAQSRHLSDQHQLKRIAQPRFWQANDPVVLLSGTGFAAGTSSTGPLLCRFPDQTVTGFEFPYNGKQVRITIDSLGEAIPRVDCTNLPQPISALLDEFFFLDPDNATVIADKVFHSADTHIIAQLSAAMAGYKSVTGVLPELKLTSWSQPWEPLFMEWQVRWYPVSYKDAQESCWAFDGTDYQWKGHAGEALTPQVLHGRIFLSPHAKFNLQSRLQQFLKDNPDADLRKIEDFIKKIDQWDFLSQTLNGFQEQLALCDPMSNLAPDDLKVLFPPDQTMARLIGNQASGAPDPGPVNSPDPFKPVTSTFHGIRAGQFCFERLTIIDRFGQSMEVIDSQNADSFYPILAKGLQPQQTVEQNAPARFVELPPRLLQPGRLNFDYISATDDSKAISLNREENPISAWFLPNHLDHGLSIYDPQGMSMGELRLTINETQKKVVSWIPAPHSTYQTLDKLGGTYPHLGQFLNNIIAKGNQAFLDFLAIIDKTLWTVDPLGERYDQNLSVLIGRPLALVRARLQLELYGPPIKDSSWAFTFSPKEPDFPNYNFPIRLGDEALRQDGLIGYFLGNGYSQFNAIHRPSEEEIDLPVSPYIKYTGSGNYINLQFNPASTAYITMLIDPRGSVQAETGILPTIGMNLPDRYVKKALANMEVTFQTGPILTSIETADKIFMPQPTEKKGVWSWLESDGRNWREMEIVNIDQKAKFSKTYSLRSGLLKLFPTMK